MHAEYYHVIPRFFTEIKINQLSYFEELDSKGYLLPKPLFMVPPFYRIHFWVLILMTWEPDTWGISISLCCFIRSYFTSTQQSAPALEYDKLERAFSVDCFRLHNSGSTKWASRRKWQICAIIWTLSHT